MSLPDGVTTCLVTYGPITNTLGTLAESISVAIVADRTIVHGASGRTLFKNTETFTAEAGGSVQIPVPHVDQAGFRDQQQNALTNWYYTITLTARFPNGGQEIDRKVFQPMTGQVTVDADLLPSDGLVISGVTAPTAVVTSVNGETGAVTVEAGGGSAVDQKIVVNPSGDTTGVTDQAAVAAALDTLLSADVAGGWLELGAGDFYWTSQQIDIYNDYAKQVRLKISGQGQATRIHSTATGAAGIDKALFYVYGGGDVAPYPTQTEIGAVGYNWLEISDLSLFGNASATGLALWGVYQGRVANIYGEGFSNASKFGSVFYLPYCIDLVIENPITFKSNYGLFAEGWFNVNNVIGGWFMGSVTAGACIDGIYATGNNFWGTIFQTAGSHGLQIKSGVKGTRLWGCWIENNSRGVVIEGDDVIIDGPTIAANGRDFEIKGTASNVIIRAPHVAGTPSTEIASGATGIVFEDTGALMTYANVIDGTAGAEVTFRRGKAVISTNLTSGSAFTVPGPAIADRAIVKLTASAAATLPAPVAGHRLHLTLVQSTGGQLVSWPADVRWPNGVTPVLSDGAAERDLLEFVCEDGEHWLGRVLGQGYVTSLPGGGTVDPTSVSGMVAWYDASQLALSDGTAVATWTDASGAGRAAAQSDAAKRPVLHTTGSNLINGKPVAKFDGADGLVTNIGGGLNLSHPATIYAVLRSDGGGLFAYDGVGSTNRLALFLDSGKFAAYSSAQITSTSNAVTGTVYRTTAIYNGASSVLRVNGAQVAAGNTGASTITNFSVGFNQAGIQGWNGAIAEILVYSGAHTTEQIATVESYLAEKYVA